MIWFTADTHFGHEHIIGYCRRPFESIEGMGAELIRRWNSKVQPEDTVYHLGDFAFAKYADVRALKNSLNGNIVFLKGNHDKKGHIKSMILDINKHSVFLTHRPEDATPLMLSLCGHVHERWKHCFNNICFNKKGCAPSMPIINVGVDAWDFYPVSFEQIKNYIREVEL